MPLTPRCFDGLKAGHRCGRKRGVHRTGLRRPKDAESGSATLVVVVGLPTFVLLLILVLDLGVAFVGRAQLQKVSDNGARAALTESTRTGRQGAESIAQELARGSTVVGGGVALNAQLDVQWGTFDFRTLEFTAVAGSGGPPPQAIRVTARRTGDSPSGALSGIMGPIDVAASAVASYRCRDVVLVQDVSVSFSEELAQAKEALLRVADSLAVSSPGTTRVGLVSFQTRASVELPLSEVPQQALRLNSEIQALSTCADQAICVGTNVGDGLNRAIRMLESSPPACEADRLIILVSDGAPCGPQGDSSLEPDPEEEPFGRVGGALDRVARADSLGISIAPVLLNVPGQGALCGAPPGGAEAFNASLATGFGLPLVAERANELPDQVLTTLSGFPIVLVR